MPNVIFIVEGKKFLTKNKAYAYVRELHQEWNDGRLVSPKVEVFVNQGGHSLLYERINLDEDFHEVNTTQWH